MYSVREVGADARQQFEAACFRVGQGVARKAFARAINHEMARTMTPIKRIVAKQTSAKYRDVNRQIGLLRANGASLKAAIRAVGGAMPLKDFGARQFSYGVSARVWGRRQRFKSAFIVNSLGGHAFTRSTKDRTPIDKMWGPIIPREMMKVEPVSEFDAGSQAVQARAMHELARIMDGTVKG